MSSAPAVGIIAPLLARRDARRTPKDVSMTSVRPLAKDLSQQCLVSNTVIDTDLTTDTIDYVATDQDGLTFTSTQ